MEKNNENCKNDIFSIGDCDVEKCSKMDFTTNKNPHQKVCCDLFKSVCNCQKEDFASFCNEK